MTEPERKPDFYWNSRPVYRCRACAYERVENLGAVLEHENTHGPAIRPSRILGTDGEPLLVEDKE